MSRLDSHRAVRQLAQEGGPSWLRLVRIRQRDEGTVYRAVFLEFDGDGELQETPGDEVKVVNLAEPAGSDGVLGAGTDTVAMDVEGRWVVFVRPPTGVSFLARVVSCSGGSVYAVREQSVDSQGRLGDATGMATIAATNLAEQTLGPGAAVDAGTIVVVHAMADSGDPPVLTYFFDHPVYAKYLP